MVKIKDANKDMEDIIKNIRLLYVDDEEQILNLFKLEFGDDYNIVTAPSAEIAMEILRKVDIDIILTDERMPQMGGIEFLSKVVEKWPETIRIIVSAYSDADRLLRAINVGHAHEYILKPWDIEELQSCLIRSCELVARRIKLQNKLQEATVLKEDIKKQFKTEWIVGERGGLKEVLSNARKVSDSEATVLIVGETGTGKELIARYIHENSPRKNGPFIRVNCAALNESLLESEMFGHERGAFTGAIKSRKGRFELANHGTIFLDEIGDISPKMQAALLRVLQEKEYERVGGSHTIKTNARVLTATNIDLEASVRDGGFREDLFYRLNIFPVEIPPLCERKQDIEALLVHFIDKFNTNKNKKASYNEDVLVALKRYSWPGNVREFENIVQRAMILSQGHDLLVEHFSFDLRQTFQKSLKDKRKKVELDEIKNSLVENDGNVSRAAKALGIPRTTLISRAKKYGIL